MEKTCKLALAFLFSLYVLSIVGCGGGGGDSADPITNQQQDQSSEIKISGRA